MKEKAKKVCRKICTVQKKAVTLHRKKGVTPRQTYIRFHVRVVRYRSAKPFTPVRIWLAPLKNPV